MLEVDYKLKEPIHGAKTIKALQWDVTFGLDYVMCPLLGGDHETNDSSADMPVLAFGQGGVGTNHEVVPIDQNNSTINRLIIRVKKPNNDEYPRERNHELYQQLATLGQAKLSFLQKLVSKSLSDQCVSEEQFDEIIDEFAAYKSERSKLTGPKALTASAKNGNSTTELSQQVASLISTHLKKR